MDNEDIFNLQEDLEDSDIAIKVDVLDPSMCSDEFRKLIMQDLVEIK